MSVHIINGRIDGTRTTVYEILHSLEAGRTPLEVHQSVRIPLAHVLAAVRHIDEHREEVMAVHRLIEARVARGNPPEIEAKLRESHERLLRRQGRITARTHA